MKRFAVITMAAGALAIAAPLLAVQQQSEEQAEPKKLTVGDPAPAIEISHWVKGEPVESFEEGKVYVMEFWATWCGPCRASMPHISEVQDKMRDYGVTVIGVSDEKLSTVVGFLAKADQEDELWYDKIRYTLATDPDRSVYSSYMTAAAQRGIPTSFIVGKDGHVEWIGHPMGMDEPLNAVVHDEWDRDAFREEFVQKQEAARKAMEAQQKLRTAQANEDWPAVLKLIDEMIADNPENPGYRVYRFTVMLADMNVPEQAYKYGRELVKDQWDNPGILNQIAWMVVDDARLQTRDLDFALDAAQRANELTEESDPAILDTLARVHYEMGDLDAALNWQRKAAEKAAGTPFEEDINAALKKYESEAKN